MLSAVQLELLCEFLRDRRFRRVEPDPKFDTGTYVGQANPIDLTAMQAAGLIERLAPGCYRLTEAGLSLALDLNWACQTSVADGLITVKSMVDIETLSACLLYESNSQQPRATLMHAIDVRIRKLQKLGRKA